MELKIILMGPPGSGKGTQSVRISKFAQVPVISSGDIFRDHQQRSTELGRLAHSYMERGEYVPDSVTIKMIIGQIKAQQQTGGFILDGFPRTLAQAEALDLELSSSGGVDIALYIKVSNAELTRRLSGRMTCSNCQKTYHVDFSPPRNLGECDHCKETLYHRTDDKLEVVSKRIDVYINETKPVIEYYRQKGILIELNGVGTIDEVEQALTLAIK